MIKKLKPFFPHLLSLGSGASLAYAFAPFYQAWIAFVAPCILLHVTQSASPKTAFKYGFLFGCGLFGFGIYWIFHSIFHFGQTTAFLAYLITGLFILYLALFPGLMMYVTNRWFGDKTFERACISFPVLWVIFEMIRGYLFTGFPWLFLGTSQIYNTAFSSYAPIGSVWLVSWLVLVCAGILYCFILFLSAHDRNKKHLYTLLGPFILIWVVGGILDNVQWGKREEVHLDAALVQGNIPQRMRWTSEHIAEIMNRYEDLTKEAVTKADIVIWPEGAIPLPIPYSNRFLNEMSQVAQNNQAALIVGVPEKAPNQESYYNALVGLGLATGAYYKERLVPFGEFVPFEKLLRGLIGFFDLPMSSFITKEKEDTEPLTIFGLKVAPSICYEIAYPTIVQKHAKDADFIITVSNDTWFGRTIGPRQHLEIAKWRAIETGRYVLRATNTGLTAIIEPDGQAELAHQFKTAILYGKVVPIRGNTPWVKFGIWPLLILLAITLLSYKRAILPKSLSAFKAQLKTNLKRLKSATTPEERREKRRRRKKPSKK